MIRATTSIAACASFRGNTTQKTPLNSGTHLAEAVPDLSTLVTAIVAGNLANLLSTPGPFTVFAPNNE
eukprot:gene20830-24682_t